MSFFTYHEHSKYIHLTFTEHFSTFIVDTRHSLIFLKFNAFLQVFYIAEQVGRLGMVHVRLCVTDGRLKAISIAQRFYAYDWRSEATAKSMLRFPDVFIIFISRLFLRSRLAQALETIEMIGLGWSPEVRIRIVFKVPLKIHGEGPKRCQILAILSTPPQTPSRPNTMEICKFKTNLSSKINCSTFLPIMVTMVYKPLDLSGSLGNSGVFSSPILRLYR